MMVCGRVLGQGVLADVSIAVFIDSQPWAGSASTKSQAWSSGPHSLLATSARIALCSGRGSSKLRSYSLPSLTGICTIRVQCLDGSETLLSWLASGPDRRELAAVVYAVKSIPRGASVYGLGYGAAKSSGTRSLIS